MKEVHIQTLDPEHDVGGPEVMRPIDRGSPIPGSGMGGCKNGKCSVPPA